MLTIPLLDWVAKLGANHKLAILYRQVWSADR